MIDSTSSIWGPWLRDLGANFGLTELETTGYLAMTLLVTQVLTWAYRLTLGRRNPEVKTEYIDRIQYVDRDVPVDRVVDRVVEKVHIPSRFCLHLVDLLNDDLVKLEIVEGASGASLVKFDDLVLEG